jgi:hypothetical protein
VALAFSPLLNASSAVSRSWPNKPAELAEIDGVIPAPRLDRPLYHGAIVASVWLLLLLALTFGLQLPFMLVRFIGIENPEEAMAHSCKKSHNHRPPMR